MPEMNYTIKDVANDLRFALTLSYLYTVDDEGFWIDQITKQRLVHKLDANDSGKEVVNFQDPLPKGDYYFFNPFVEGYGSKSPATSLYYKVIRISLNINVAHLAGYVIRTILATKAAIKAKEEYRIPSTLLRMTAVQIDRKQTLYDVADERMEQEFEQLFENAKNEVLFVPYMRHQRSARVQCDALTDPQWDEKYGKDVRKKTLLAFKAVIMGILGIEKPEELETLTVKCDPDTKTAARFQTTMSVFLKIYSRFNDILAEAWAVDGVPQTDREINLDELANIIERFPMAYTIARHMVQPTLPASSATSTDSADTSGLRIGGSGSRFGHQPRRFGNSEPVDRFGGTRQGGLSFGQPAQPASRFQPHVISDRPVDPMAPLARPNNASSFGGSGISFNSPSSGFGFGGGGFGGGFGGGGGLSLDASVPSNFGLPGARRSF